jgi:hypothetical protein
VAYGSSPSVITSLLVTNQGEFTSDFSYQLVDSTGQTYGINAEPPPPPPVTVTSDNPAVVAVANGSFGPRFFAVSMANGSANLVFTTSDGCVRSLPVTVNLEASPQFIAASISPPAADNSGLITNTLYWQGTTCPYVVGIDGTGDFSFDDIEYDYDNNSLTWSFGVPAGTPPGEYLLYSSFTFDSAGATSYIMLNVANAPSRGQIAGEVLVVDNGGSMMMQQEVSGNLEIYDAQTGAGVATNSIANFNTSAYSVGYVQPGSYCVRFVPMNSMMAPQWYPNAASFAQAAAVSVSAGQTASNINFYLAPVPVPPPSLLLPSPAAHCAGGVASGDWDFCLGATVSGVTYYLEYKVSLADAEWTVAQTITGDGLSQTLVDTAPLSSQRFYRLRMLAP